MRELGYLEGRDYGVEGRYADGDASRLPLLAEELVLSDVANPGTMLQRREVEAAAEKLGVSMAAVDVHTVDEIGAAIQTFVRERASIVVVLASARFVNARRRIAAFALASRLPTVYNFREHVEDGGLISYGVDLRQNNRRSAYFVDRILKGEKPGDLPVEFPTKVELVVNVTTAKALGLEIPATLLARADEVIE